MFCKNKTLPRQKSLKFSDYRKSRKTVSDLILCLFGFVKATKFRDSSEYSQCVQNVLAKSWLPCQIYTVISKMVAPVLGDALMHGPCFIAGGALW